MFLYINCVKEDTPGEKWATLFEKSWPYYKKWYTMEGLLARPGYATCYRNIKDYMPQLTSIYEKLCDLAGGGDLASRFLSLYSPPPYLSGCSQIVWKRDTYSLIRNYDYSPYYFEGVVLYTNWLKPVIAMSDCNWGVLDGMNAQGLSVSLTFGGSKEIGVGFGIPLILRYVLEVASNTAEATEILRRIPVHMAYNVTVLDAQGHYVTVLLAPKQPAIVTEYPIATNHQSYITWQNYATATATEERQAFLHARLDDPYETEQGLVQKFFKAPLYNTHFEKGFGTIYTALYRPYEGLIKYLWKSKKIVQSFQNFEEKCTAINLQKGRSGKLFL